MPTNNKPLTTGKVAAICVVALGLGLGALIAGLPHRPSTPLVTTNSHTGKAITCHGGVEYGAKTDCARALSAHGNTALVVVGVLLLLVAAAVGVVLAIGLVNRSRARSGQL